MYRFFIVSSSYTDNAGQGKGGWEAGETPKPPRNLHTLPGLSLVFSFYALDLFVLLLFLLFYSLSPRPRCAHFHRHTPTRSHTYRKDTISQVLAIQAKEEKGLTHLHYTHHIPFLNPIKYFPCHFPNCCLQPSNYLFHNPRMTSFCYFNFH